MKKRIFRKIAALIIVAVIAIVNTIPAFAMFGPLNNAAGELSSYYGQFDITDGVTAHPENKLIITLPDADLSAASGGSFKDFQNTVDATITYDDTVKTATFAFETGIEADGGISIAMHGICSPVGTHPYIAELYSGETGTTTELESGEYTISDNGLTVNLNVAQYFSFGLTTNSLDIDLAFFEAMNRTERGIDWRVSTNADSYTVSCRLKTPFTSGADTFPTGKAGYTPFEQHQKGGVYIGALGPQEWMVPELRDHYTCLTETSMTLASGLATNVDQGRVTLVLIADATVRPGVYTGVIEFTGTPTF